ncbi:MAG TPA: 3-keto-5-aminohexanoate cleavage protein, partial [Steroidobacteraceae bacterium]|nr:3-keto-5-aminohexanoate cleavage protein [Steroidobacteraceae bacterium]
MLAAEAFITCAVTGSADSARKSPNVPVTPAQIAASALDAHAAGAAIVHLHVRDPQSGLASRDPGLFREVVERIRSRNTEVILNLTGGMGGDLMLGPDAAPLEFRAGTDLVGPAARMAHIVELGPEIGSLDCGSLNFDELLYATTPSILR